MLAISDPMLQSDNMKRIIGCNKMNFSSHNEELDDKVRISKHKIEFTGI